MNKTRLLLAVIALGFSQQVFAVNLWCTGTVTRQYVDSASRVFILPTYAPSYTMVCDLDTTWNGITPDLCKTWFAQLQAAFHTQSLVIVYYNAVSYPSCGDLPSYTAAPTPGYVMNRL